MAKEEPLTTVNETGSPEVAVALSSKSGDRAFLSGTDSKSNVLVLTGSRGNNPVLISGWRQPVAITSLSGGYPDKTFF